MRFKSLKTMASSSSSLLFCVFTLSCLISMASSSEDDVPATIIIPLTSRFTKNPSTDPTLFFQQLASASSARLEYLKHGKNRPSLQTPVFPVHGGHFIGLSFGTPPQAFSMLVDTGSHVVWFPCSSDYRCDNCPDEDIRNTRIFHPELSSSSKVLHCGSPKCVDADSPNIQLGCPHCNDSSNRCVTNCPYYLQYGRGAAAGHFLLENLNFPGKTFHNFLVGCSTSTKDRSVAIAGFGNTILSLPSQMGAKKFAYCLKSHALDDTADSSKLLIDYKNGDTKGVSYAPFLKNPPQYPVYYYLSVEGIMIGDKLLQIPHEYLAPGSDSRGGVLIDSGFTFGYMAKPVFSIVTTELKKQMSEYRRSFEAEKSGLPFSPCYNLTGESSIKIPDLVYKFTTGASMVVPGEKYFKSFPEYDLWCFPVSTDTGSLEVTPGPSIILGNYMQVDFYVEFDLINKRFGFRKQTC